MHVRKAWIAAGLMLLALSGCNTIAPTVVAPTAVVPTTTPHVEDNDVWAIIPPERAEQQHLEVELSLAAGFEGYWTPAAEDVLKVEEQVGAYLSQNPDQFFREPPVWERLGDYQRQYVGVMLDGKRVIYGNFFCNDAGHDWKQDWVSVDDGGDCFFQVKYDLATGTFIGLQVNGEA